ncbi:hypothetical protein Q2941_30115 [Bradyrhizobium sp. UFLA05-153]
MSSGQGPDRQSKLLHAWQLALLRLAITLEEADRLNVLAIAGEADRLAANQRGAASFRFFRRTSVELSLAILGASADADTVLRRFHAQIDHPTLKRAFGAAVGIKAQHHARHGMTICSGNCRHGRFTL